MLRNEVGSVLARQVGIQAVTPVRGVAVYINGEYWGFTWLNVRMDAHFLQEQFNAPTREFDIVGNGEHWLDTDDFALRTELQYKNSYAGKDLTCDETFARLEAILDIDDKMRYYAFQIFMGNHDWPHNNLRRWRYTGEQTEGLPPELDGRWRYIVFDLDWTLGLYGDDHNLRTFQRVLEERNDAGALLRNILTRPDMLIRFDEIMREVMDVLSPHRIHNTIEELFGWIEGEVVYALQNGKYSNWVSHDSVRDNHRAMLRFAAYRPDVMRWGLERLMKGA
jgi:hypothetical protein